MELLKRRPLVIICIASIILMYISACISARSFWIIVLLTMAPTLLAVGLTIVFFRNKRKALLRMLICIFIFCIISTTLSLRAYDFYNVKYSSVETSIDKECVITGEITEVGYKNEYGERLYGTLSSIDDKPVDVNVVIEIEGESDLFEGSIFTLNGTPEDFTDEESYLMADGNVAKIICEDLESIVITDEAEQDLGFWFNKVNTKLQRRFYRFVDEDTGALIGALTLGNRDLLASNVTRDFRRCGISHVLALSGLHMTIIIGFFDLILQKLYVDRRIRCFILAALGLAYLALTGFSMSASRAVIMLCMVYLAHLLWEDSDPITSLALATVIILALNPFALYAVSLWMSVIATLGIVVVSEIISPLGYKIKKKPLKLQILYKLLTSVSLTLAAIFFVSVFNWLCFGEISIVSPITNLIITPLITVILIMGLLMLLLSFIFPLAKLIGVGASFLCRIVLGLSERISEMRGITVSLKYEFVNYIAIPFIIALIVFLIAKVKRKWTIALLPTAAVIAFVICFNVHLNHSQGMTNVAYTRDGTSEMMILTNNESATVCDISTGGYRHLAGACRTAYENCATEIENIIITHYHNYHPHALMRVSDKYTVRRILLPEPEGTEEFEIYENIINTFSKRSTEVVTYRRGYANDVGEDCTVNVSQKYYIKRSTHPMLMISVMQNSKSDQSELLYFSSPIFENNFVDYPTFPDYIIVGLHGPRIHKAPDLELISLSVPRILLLTDGEKMLSDDNTIKILESIRDEFDTQIIIDKENFEFILN